MTFKSLIFVQQELVKDLISTNDATIIGVLLAVIALLIIWLVRQDKKLENLNEYIRQHNTSTLEIMSELTNTLKDRQEIDKDVKNSVDTIHLHSRDNNAILKNLSRMIQDKIFNMRNNDNE